MSVITKATVRKALRALGGKTDPESICVFLMGPHRSGSKSDSYGKRHIARASQCLLAVCREDDSRADYQRAVAEAAS